MSCNMGPVIEEAPSLNTSNCEISSQDIIYWNRVTTSIFLMSALPLSRGTLIMGTVLQLTLSATVHNLAYFACNYSFERVCRKIQIFIYSNNANSCCL